MLIARPLGLGGLVFLTLAAGCGPMPDDDMPPATAAAVQPSEQVVQVDPNADVYADTDPSALTDFRATLDPHGTWAEDPTYGTVWVPNPAEVGPDFSPYETAGHWEYDDSDYVWVSDYDWGWGPFHYGRWMYGPAGWFWIPGRVYAPAWVSWRLGGPDFWYVGWAPMAPAFYWRGGVAFGVAPMVVAPAGFYYCAHGDMFASSIGGHVVARAEVATVAEHTQAYGGGGAAMRGPAPQALGIAPSSVVHASPNSRGLQMAKAFARPSTAKALGAHPPTPHKAIAAPGARPAAVRGAGRGVTRGGGGGHVHR
jgi:hypothetical protein